MVNDWWDVGLWVGIGEGGLFGGRDNCKNLKMAAIGRNM